MGNIAKFYPRNSAENPDLVLEQAIGNYDDVLILGYDKWGDFDPRSTLGLNVGEIIILMEIFKRDLLAGEYTDEAK